MCGGLRLVLVLVLVLVLLGTLGAKRTHGPSKMYVVVASGEVEAAKNWSASWKNLEQSLRKVWPDNENTHYTFNLKLVPNEKPTRKSDNAIAYTVYEIDKSIRRLKVVQS